MSTDGTNYYEPDEGDFALGDPADGECPVCGSRLQFKQLFTDADEGVDYCPECGWEGGIG